MKNEEMCAQREDLKVNEAYEGWNMNEKAVGPRVN
jgi:hypothetical protein